MSGYKYILRLERIKQQCKELGMRLGYPKSQWDSAIDYVAVMPEGDDALPIYSRDAELFIGTLDQLEVWLRGVDWARTYDSLLKISNPARRERQENLIRQQHTVSMLKDEPVRTLK